MTESKRSSRSKQRLPIHRTDHAVRLLLNNLSAIESLSGEDQQMLCALDAPQGPLFAWLESQWHEHGAQPWAALLAGLEGHPSEAYARALMNDYLGHEDIDPQESLLELRLLVNRIQVDQLKALETAAIEAAKTDPAALERYRQLQARRMTLESTANVSAAPAPNP